MANDRFGVVDYVVFLLMMLISTLIGIWYGCGPGGRQKTTAEYLLGDRKMSHWPVAISLLVTFLSAVSLIGIPSEVYTYGIQYCVSILFGPILSLLPVSIIFVPMYRRVNITCANEYLERRFSVGVRMVGCALFMLHNTLYLSVAIFAPSLALEAVAGIPLPVSILTTGIVCTFYTSLGGLKAVVWTDVFQSVVMMGGLIAILVIGSVEVGGLDKVWQINKAYNRTTLFDFNPDPKVRNTFWTLTIGGALTIMPTWSVSQTYVQRFLAMKSLKDAKRAVWINVPALMIYGLVCSLAGLVIFAVYSGCDPRADKKIASNDQALPYFVINKLHHLHGVPGLFTGSLYAGALSTASSALNAMSLVVLEDIIKKTKRNLTDSEAARLCKMIAVVFGVIVIGGAFVVRYLGAMVLQLSLSIAGIVSGPLLGIFLLGMFVRRANVKGAYAGVFCGIAMAFWVFVGSGLYPPNKYPGTRSVRDCQFYKNALFYQSIAANVSAMNVSFVTQKQVNDSMKILEKYGDGYIHNSYKSHGVEIADTLYHISYLWLSGLGIVTSFVVGLVISYLLETKADRQKEIDPKLLFPAKEWLYGFLPGHSFTWDIDDDLTKVDGETKKESIVEDFQEFATSHSEIEDSVVNETTKDEQMTQSCYETKF
ncbi:sodium-coupled monocarboxylate transporter 1-like [Montipora capricornis]|uniref:sodium-coupled monocarboxylate transporter 1-like n=1 Tax=Montipora capricornis TaxID=246305 RepID=UPI0035F16108